jgi:hypothetical protein
MRRGETLPSAAPGRGDAMKKWGYIAVHAVVAAVFIFLLQRFTLSASLETSLLWALTFAGCAAGLAYMQANR